MSNQKSALDAMLEQYEKNNAPKYVKSETAKVYDLDNYFNTYIPEGVKSATKQIRILPTADGSTPFVEVHAHKVLVDGEWKTFACLKHEKGEACPFCEAREALLATGRDSDKELAKKYNARKMYVVKVIDRDDPKNKVKFWRFNHDYRKEGIYDKIIGVLNAIKKDVTNAETGRDLLLTINRNQNNVPVVSAVASLDPSVLSENAELRDTWLSDERTWEDVYAVKSYDYLEIIVRGGVPVWDKGEKKFVDKNSVNADDETDESQSEITMGVENVKANILAAETTTAPASSSSDEDQDDLPF
jgi:predicted secreted protein